MRRLCSVVMLALAAGMVAAGTALADDSLRSRSVRLTYRAEVRDLPAGAQRVALWLPFPPSNEQQAITGIVVRSDVPTTVGRDEESGNQVLSLSVAPPGDRPVWVELQCDVLRRERRNREAAASQAGAAPPSRIDPRWLAPDRLVPLDGAIRELAGQVTRGRATRLEQARAIYDHTVSTLTYDKSGEGWGRGDIRYACDQKRGNCTDFHAVFIGLCRARGIPARFEIGVTLPTDAPSGEIAGYHCWADCYVSGTGWVPVDCSEAQKRPERRDYFFGAQDEHRVTLSTGRDLRLVPEQEGERLNFFVFPYAEVDGRPHEKIERLIRFENQERRIEKRRQAQECSARRLLFGKWAEVPANLAG